MGIVSSGYSTVPIMANYGDYEFSSKLAKPFKLANMESNGLVLNGVAQRRNGS
jgi:hypothetical protein